MSQITKGAGGPQNQSDKDTNTKLGVPEGAVTEDSPGGYGGTDRLQSEAGPIHPDAGKDQAKDI